MPIADNQGVACERLAMIVKQMFASRILDWLFTNISRDSIVEFKCTLRIIFAKKWMGIVKTMRS